MCFIETDGREKLWQRYRCCGCLNRRKPFTLRPSNFGAGICCTFLLFLHIYLYVYIYKFLNPNQVVGLCYLVNSLWSLSLRLRQRAQHLRQHLRSLRWAWTKDGLLQRGLRGRRRVLSFGLGVFLPCLYQCDIHMMIIIYNCIYIYIYTCSLQWKTIK